MAKSDSWCGLASSKDFEPILQNARSSIKSDAQKHRSAITKNAADAKLAQKRGRDHVPKPVAAVRQFVILIRDQNYEKNAKASGSKKEKKSKVESGGEVVIWKGLANQIMEYETRLTARKCDVCGKSCIIIPVPGLPPIHKELTKADIKLWAQLAAKSPEVSLTSPPSALQLQYSDNHPSRRKAKAPTTNDATPSAGPSNHGGNAQVPPLYAGPAVPPPNLYNPYYPPMPPMPPPMPYGYFGGYPGPYAGYPLAYPGALGHPPAMGGGGNMPLLEWLSRCDRGQRGENHENFSGLVAGLTAKNLHSLSDLRGKSEEYFLSIDFPTTPGGPTFRIHPDTAARLVQYVNADLPHF
ncbi:hypothetical protein FRC11_008350 [Ceratobasidium sp. 423]|nr:hypothetical protein FRC11_008350 [Ceratobasidium sp. 423]